MITRIQIPITIKPGRMADAVSQMNETIAVLERLTGVTGQMFTVAYGERCFGGAILVWDFPSPEAQAEFESASGTDADFQAVLGRVLASDSPWILPAPREMLRQVI